MVGRDPLGRKGGRGMVIDRIQNTEGFECWTEEFDLKKGPPKESDQVCILKSSLWHLCIE